MRFVLAFAFATLAIAPAAFAVTDKILDVQEMTALETRAAQASPKEQCFLYAELAHSMAELASQQFTAGQTAQASASLKAVQKYAEKIHMGVADDAKKLKNAEILMRHTAYRLKEIMLGASLDDRPTLEATLKQLDQVQSEMMLQVFKR
ncbi:MAG TPA: hypothetical protein VK729_05055 [Silvibacterium sp.]|jgi:hypothetical protein|nr:hypothetical protein [Silvibacterium sp.]